MSEEPLKIGQRKITEIVPEKNKSGLSVYHTCFGDFCRASDVDLVIASKDNEIRQLKRALEESHKMEVEQLLMEIAGLKKLVETADKLLKPKGGFTIKDITFNGVKMDGVKNEP